MLREDRDLAVLVAQLSTEATQPSTSHQWDIGWSSDEYWPNWQPPYPLVLRLTSAATFVHLDRP